MATTSPWHACWWRSTVLTGGLSLFNLYVTLRGFCDTTGAALSHEYWVEVNLAKQGKQFCGARQCHRPYLLHIWRSQVHNSKHHLCTNIVIRWPFFKPISASTKRTFYELWLATL